MGCTSYHRLASEHEKLSKRLSQICKEKQAVYLDKIQLESEVSMLKRNFYDALNQAETMKKEISTDRSTEFPEIFESAYDTEVVGDWLEMDLRDGDQLLEALTIVFPPAVPEVRKLQAHSLNLRRSDSSLRDYLRYFAKRFELFYASWRDILSDQKQVEGIKQQLKMDLAAAIQRVESFLGKRSDALNDLHSEFRRICDLQTTDFLKEHRNLQKRLTGLLSDMYIRKLEEKDQERHRVIHLLEGEVQKVTNRKRSEIAAEIRGEIESLANERVSMVSEDLRATSIRGQSDREMIQSVLTEEIEQRVLETKQQRDMFKHEKAILTRKYAEEVNSLRKENDALRRELQSLAVAKKEELKVTKENADNELKIARERHEREMREIDGVLKGLKEDFLRKSDMQKAVYEERLASDRGKLGVEIERLENELVKMRQVISEKEALLSESDSKSSDLVFHKLVTGLLGRITLLESSLQSSISTVFAAFNPAAPKHFEKDEEERSETVAVERIKEAEIALKSLAEQGETDLQSGLFGECWKALKSDPRGFIDALMRPLEVAITSMSSTDNSGERDERRDKVASELLSVRSELETLRKTHSEETAEIRSDLEVARLRLKSATESLREKSIEVDELYKEIERLKNNLAAKDQRLQKLISEKDRISPIASPVLLTPKHQRAKTDYKEREVVTASPKSVVFEENIALQKYLREITQRDYRSLQVAAAQRAKSLELTHLSNQQKLKGALRRLTSHLKSIQRSSLFRWKLSTPCTVSGRKTVTPFHLPPVSPRSYHGEMAFGGIDALFEDEQKADSRDVGMETVYRAITRNEVPMLSSQTFRLMDEVLEAKYHSDLDRIERRRVPLSLPHFAMEYLVQSLGGEKPAKKALGQALLCLRTHLHESQAYTYVLCRLLHFGVSNGVSLEMSVFIVKSRAALDKYVQKPTSQTPEKRPNADLSAGRLPLSNALDYIYDTFAGDCKAGETAVALCRPESVPAPDYFAMVVGHKVAKLGITAEEAFRVLSKRSHRSVTSAEFVECARQLWTVWADDENLAAAFSRLSLGQNTIERQQFLDALATVRCDVTVTRAGVLKALLETAEHRDREVAEELLAAVNDGGQMTFRRFADVALRLDSTLDAERIAALWEAAEGLAAPDAVTPLAIVRALLRHRIGKYAQSPFCKSHSDDSRIDSTVQALEDLGRGGAEGRGERREGTEGPTPSPRRKFSKDFFST